MARGDRVGNGEDVVRYVKPSEYDGDIVVASAFHLRENELGLSVNRRAIFDADTRADLSAICQAMVGRGFKVKRTGGLAEIGVGDVEAVGAAIERDLFVLDCAEPEDATGPANPAHAEIAGLPLKGAEPDDVQSQRAGHDLARKCKAVHATA